MISRDPEIETNTNVKWYVICCYGPSFAASRLTNWHGHSIWWCSVLYEPLLCKMFWDAHICNQRGNQGGINWHPKETLMDFGTSLWDKSTYAIIWHLLYFNSWRNIVVRSKHCHTLSNKYWKQSVHNLIALPFICKFQTKINYIPTQSPINIALWPNPLCENCFDDSHMFQWRHMRQICEILNNCFNS